MNETIVKFGHPGTLVHEYAHWVVLLRPAQITIGSLVLACKEDATAFSSISAGASAEIVTAVQGIESTVGRCFSVERFNYLMLMMVDPNVHFHVIPRYSSPVSFEGGEYADSTYPKPPDVTSKLEMSGETFEKLRKRLMEDWG